MSDDEGDTLISLLSGTSRRKRTVETYVAPFNYHGSVIRCREYPDGIYINNRGRMCPNDPRTGSLRPLKSKVCVPSPSSLVPKDHRNAKMGTQRLDEIQPLPDDICSDEEDEDEDEEDEDESEDEDNEDEETDYDHCTDPGDEESDWVPEHEDETDEEEEDNGLVDDFEDDEDEDEGSSVKDAENNAVTAADLQTTNETIPLEATRVVMAHKPNKPNDSYERKRARFLHDLLKDAQSTHEMVEKMDKRRRVTEQVRERIDVLEQYLDEYNSVKRAHKEYSMTYESDLYDNPPRCTIYFSRKVTATACVQDDFDDDEANRPSTHTFHFDFSSNELLSSCGKHRFGSLEHAVLHLKQTKEKSV